MDQNTYAFQTQDQKLATPATPDVFTTPSGATVSNSTGALVTPPPNLSTVTSAGLAPATTPPVVPPEIPPVPPPPAPDTAPTPQADTAAPPTPKSDEITRRINEAMGLQDTVAGKDAYKAQLLQDQGLTPVTDENGNVTYQNKTLNDLNAQLKKLTAESLQIPLQLQTDATGRGITSGGLRPIEAGMLRNNAVASLGVQAQLSAVKDNIVLARNLVDQMVTTKYGADEAKLKAKLANLDLLMKDPSLTAEQQDRANAQSLKLEKEKTKLQTNKEDATTIASWALAMGKYTPTDPTQPKPSQLEIDNVMKLSQSDDPEKLRKAMAIYSKYSNDPQELAKQANALEIQRLTIAKTTEENAQAKLTNPLDIKKSNLELKNIQSQIDERNAKAAGEAAANASVDPNTLQGMLNVYRSTGVLPAFGLSGKSPLRAQFYAALGAEGGNQIISDANTNKSVRAGLSTAYRTQQNQLAANQTAIGTLDKQLELAKTYSDKVDRGGSPFVAKYLLQAKSGVFGDPDTAAFNNIVKTASYEFAKILSGAAASISGVTVNSQADAETLLNTAMSKGQFNTVMGLMQKEAQFRLKSQQDTISQLEKDMNNVGSLVNDVKKNTTKSGTPFDYEAAKKAGYTEKEIQDYINSN